MSYLYFLFLKRTNHILLSLQCTSKDLHSTLCIDLPYYISLAILKAPRGQNLGLMCPYLHFSTLTQLWYQ